MKAVPRPADGATGGEALPKEEALAAFQKAYPHPLNPRRRNVSKVASTDDEVGIFLPQTTKTLPDDPDVRLRLMSLVGRRPDHNIQYFEHWQAIEQLGNYPEAVDYLCELMEKDEPDSVLYCCKALSQIAGARPQDPNVRKMIPFLLKKWEAACHSPEGEGWGAEVHSYNKHGFPQIRKGAGIADAAIKRGTDAWGHQGETWEALVHQAPGTRYIPDVLALFDNQLVVPHLVKAIRHGRCDFRFHIAHALGKLGGSQAKTALEYLAEHDPFRAVRELAKETLKAGVPPDKENDPGELLPKKLAVEVKTVPSSLLRLYEKVLCPELTAAPKVDGNLDDDAWKGANVLTDFSCHCDSAPVPKATRALIGRFQGTLYVAVDCGDEKPSELRGTDQSAGWGNTSVVLLVNPENVRDEAPQVNAESKVPYHMFFVGAKGGMNHQNCGPGPLKKEQVGWEARTSPQDNGWRAELAVPFSIFPKAANIWGFNVGRLMPAVSMQAGFANTGDLETAHRFSHMVFGSQWKLRFEGKKLRNFGSDAATVNVQMEVGDKKADRKVTVPAGEAADFGLDDFLETGFHPGRPLRLVVVDPKDNGIIIEGTYLFWAGTPNRIMNTWP
jgi:hypothetical protein